MGLRRVVGLVGAAAVLAACGGGSGGGSDGAAAPPDRPALAVEVRVEPFVDATRGTDPSGSAPASPTRAAPTRIFAPAGGQPGRPYPLLVFVHGSGGLGDGYDVLLRSWASAGYVVAAPALPGSTDKEARGDWTADLANFPADVRFVIDELLRANRSGDSPLHGSIDAERIGLAGHSMGGMITLAVAGNTCCHDARVKAAVVLAGREQPFGSGQFWARIRTPVLLVHGDSDFNVTYADGRRAYANAPPPRFLLTVVDGDHGTPFTGDPGNPQARLVSDAALDFFGHYLKGESDGLTHLQARAAVPGLAKLEQEV